MSAEDLIGIYKGGGGSVEGLEPRKELTGLCDCLDVGSGGKEVGSLSWANK